MKAKMEKKVAVDEMVRQHHCLSVHEFGLTPEDSGEQRSLAC